ncbi:hypothetical protein BGZ49_008861 [Haplosporangium sp. Z 27]|nr:hypothetical protein BGZ49_008861 [Haplosporangium sp. Z 27]
MSQPYPQAPTTDSSNDLEQLIAERNSLRSQNDQLWKIIEKQRVIIQNLQKDVTKLTAERDLLSQASTGGSASSDQGYHQHQHPNGNINDNHNQSNAYHHHQQPHQQPHHHHSKRSMEKRLQESNSASDQANVESHERESEPASGIKPNASISTSDHGQQLHRNHYQDSQSPRQHESSRKQRPHMLPLTPSSNSEGEFDGGKTELGLDESFTNTNGYHHKFSQPSEGEIGSLNPHDTETQFATRVQNYQGTMQTSQTPQRSTFNVHSERDPRMLKPQADPGFSLDDYSDSTGTPRNISGSIAVAPHLMPHLPPRSPRRERKDDHNVSPECSDNEEEHNHPHQNSRRKGPLAPLLSPTRARGDYGSEQPLLLSPSFHNVDVDGQDGQVLSISKVSLKQANAFESPITDMDSSQQQSVYSLSTPVSPAPTKMTFQGTPSHARKMVSGQILSIPTSPSPQSMNSLEIGLSSPTTSYPMAPVSPIATIIDQDAEKFRVYMNKLSVPSRKDSSPTSPGADGQDNAAVLGQAVAMESIQAQNEVQNQLGQASSNTSRGLHQGYPHDQRSGTNPSVDTLVNSDNSFSQEEGREQPRGHLDNRSRRRNSSLPIMDGYPKISARSTSHHRDEDLKEPYAVPSPPKRYDSQAVSDSTSTLRSGSPTPSGNSSVNNAQSSGQQPAGASRSTTIHQQAFHMFGDNLELLSLLVVGSNIKSSDRSKEILTFTISIGQEVQSKDGVCPHREDDEYWRIEKQYTDFVNFDAMLRVTQSRNVINSLPRLPDKTLFTTHAPSKVDARKVALEQYLQQLASLHIKDTRELCEFLNTNIIERDSRKGHEAGWKEGYLTKRGKNFGGWKTRFFVLKGPVLEYFDTQKDGHHLGSIALPFAQIGRQQTQDKQDSGDSKDGAVDPNSYRHAFLILEPKKGQSAADAKRNPNSVFRHVLCAETDEERDEWVDALLKHVGKEIPVEQQEVNEREKTGRRMPEIQKVAATPIRELASAKGNEKLLLNQEAYERQQRSTPLSPSVQQFQTQARGTAMPQSPTTSGIYPDDRHTQERSSGDGQNSANSRSNHSQYNEQDQQGSWNNQQSPHSQQQQQHHLMQQQQQSPQQLPRNHSTHSLNQNQEDGSFRASPEAQAPYLSPAEVAEKKQKSRMTFHWPKKATKEEVVAQEPSNGASTGSAHDSSRKRHFLGKGGQSHSNNGGQTNTPQTAQGSNLVPVRQVFGVSLEQAIEQAQVQPGHELPAVVYRCIEYLNAHNAKLEEGIYRLNGSAAVIKGLKDRFNQEGDVPLLSSDEYYDIHAVAGLLKLFLRDLPSSVLTREMHRDFLQVIELPNRPDRVNELTRLVAILPEANYTLLRALTAHLIEIVDNADVNKMTARNVGIVFSPTLGIPAGVFALLMSDFGQIFHTNDGRIMPLENSHPEKMHVADSNGTLDGLMTV